MTKCKEHNWVKVYYRKGIKIGNRWTDNWHTIEGKEVCNNCQEIRSKK